MEASMVTKRGEQSRFHEKLDSKEPGYQMQQLQKSMNPQISDEEDLDELDPLTLRDEDGQLAMGHTERKQQRRIVSKAYEEPDKNLEFAPETIIGKVERKIWTWRKFMVGLLAFAGAATFTLALMTWMLFKIHPHDGLSPPWYPSPRGGSTDEWKQAYQRASIFVSQMSLLEKVNVTTGVGWQMGLCVGNTAPAVKTGIPPLCFQDGPLGVRFADNITAFPAAITVGSTWNRTLMLARGDALGEEFRLKGANVMLGPAMGPLGRVPAGGRNWEGFGSDPFLQGVAASLTIEGIQGQGVIATAKHFIGNEQEHYRRGLEWALPHSLSANIDDRTMHELYLWPFAESVRAGVGSVMCSYQMVNNSYACQNSKLLNGLLKDELGFQGFVQSDWLAQRSGVASSLAGLDVSMPGDGLVWADGQSLWGPRLTQAVLNSSIPMSRLNDMAARVVATWYKMGQDDVSRFPREAVGDGSPNFSSWTTETIGRLHEGSKEGNITTVNKHIDAQGSHKDIVKAIATEGIVLLKNDGNLLPIRHGGGTPKVAGKYKIAIFGDDAGSGQGPNACTDRACNSGTLGSGWGSGSVDFPYLITPAEAISKSVNLTRVELTIMDNDSPLTPSSSSFLESQDVCLVFISSDGGEGYLSWNGIRGDRNDLFPQKGGSALVKSVAAHCENTVVIVHSIGAVVVEEFIDHPNVKALLFANLPGQESGTAITSIIFGDVNPSGKLVYTVGKSLKDYGRGGQVLYVPNGAVPQQNFEEGLYIDYRHFDKEKIEPRYHFGFGKSYTTFELSDLSIEELKPKLAWPDPRPDGNEPPTFDETLPKAEDLLYPSSFKTLRNYIYPYISAVSDIVVGKYPYPKGYDTPHPLSPAGGGLGGNPSLFNSHVRISVSVKNTGSRLGQEVVQVYLRFPKNVSITSTNSSSSSTSSKEKVDFPVKVLRGFEKVELEPGETKTIQIELRRKDLSFWDVIAQNWRMPVDEEGKIGILVGTSSDEKDLVLKGEW